MQRKCSIVNCSFNAYSFQFVCLGGSTGRAKKFSLYLNAGLGLNKEEDEVLQNLCLTDRYVIYKVGSVIVANVSVFVLLSNPPPSPFRGCKQGLRVRAGRNSHFT